MRWGHAAHGRLTSCAFAHATDLPAVTQAASWGELQVSLGATQPPRSAIAASISSMSAGNAGICNMARGALHALMGMCWQAVAAACIRHAPGLPLPGHQVALPLPRASPHSLHLVQVQRGVAAARRKQIPDCRTQVEVENLASLHGSVGKSELVDAYSLAVFWQEDAILHQVCYEVCR